MKTFARVVNGVVLEIIPPVMADEDIMKPGPEDEHGVPTEVVDIPMGAEIPIERRFHPDIVAQLVEYDPANPPVPPELPVPEPVVPSRVTARQARLALLSAGKLPAVSSALAALPDGQREAAQIEWEYAGTVERESPLVLMLGAALELDLDNLFLQAATL